MLGREGEREDVRDYSGGLHIWLFAVAVFSLLPVSVLIGGRVAGLGTGF